MLQNHTLLFSHFVCGKMRRHHLSEKFSSVSLQCCRMAQEPTLAAMIWYPPDCSYRSVPEVAEVLVQSRVQMAPTAHSWRHASRIWQEPEAGRHFHLEQKKNARFQEISMPTPRSVSGNSEGRKDPRSETLSRQSMKLKGSSRGVGVGHKHQ